MTRMVTRSSSTGVIELIALESTANPVEVWATRSPASGVLLKRPCSFKEFSDVAFRVVADNYVIDDSGTGVVHCAPAFGEDDYCV